MGSAVYGAIPLEPIYGIDSSVNQGIGNLFGGMNPLERIRESGADIDIRRTISTNYARLEIVKGLLLKAQLGFSSTRQDYAIPIFSPLHSSKSIVDHDQRFFEGALSYQYSWKKNRWAISAGYSEQKFERIAGSGIGLDGNILEKVLDEVRNGVQILPGKQGILSFQHLRNSSRSRSYFVQSSLSTAALDYYVNVRKDSWGKAFDAAGGGVGWRLSGKKGILEALGVHSARLVADYGYVSPIHTIWFPDITSANLGNISGIVDRHLMSSGFEVELKGGNIHIEADYFYQVTNNPVFSKLFYIGSDQHRFISQLGKMYSRGVEISALNRLVRKERFEWTLAGNLTVMKNWAQDMSHDYSSGVISENETKNRPLGSVFVWENNGIWNTPEEIIEAGKKLEDIPGLLGMERRDESEPFGVKWLGSSLPGVIWGTTSTILWRKMDMSVRVRGEHGQIVLNGRDMGLHSAFAGNTTYFARDNAWSPDRTENNLPRQLSSGVSEYGSWYWEKAGFVRLQDVTIGYTTKITGTTNLRFFLSGQNLLLLTRYRGGDPEDNLYGQDMSRQGFDYGVYPRSSTISLGVQLRH